MQLILVGLEVLVARPGVLTFGHRQVLEHLWGVGRTISQIAGVLGVPVCTVSREVARNNSARHGTKNPLGRSLPHGRGRRPYRWGYQAQWAQRRADAARRRPARAKLAVGTRLRQVVAGKLARRWSPKQIAAWLRATFADRPELQVSHETIYQAIYVQSRGNLRAELTRQVALRSGRAQRRPQSRAAGAARRRRPWIADLHISTRPAEVTDRAVPGHWEGDLVIGKAGASAIVTLVERATRYVMLGALPHGRDSEAVIGVLTNLATRMPTHLRRSLTWDQGVEMATHPVFTVATGCPVYFCDPHSPWQRGTNENTNGLLRQYFPKSSYDFRTIDQNGLDEVAHELNTRPRQTLDWNTPAQRLAHLITA
ncbi:IS30 family transposase [Micromonospora siamensis]|uniref:Transposase and inactivated derivatives, IS30 family n=1 Tax=Micromonospora siamensis TaxID=299152 RepID=A0A1C5IGL5_9ACTN|nr:IS30 family transposase [Micromonospora siamensis]SCG57141.1 Transposase and inactivated derivatives, IS30 family [Micromonospora siamensis]